MDKVTELLARSPRRRAIYALLAESRTGMTAVELNDALGGDRRHMSRHLKELRDAGAVYIGGWRRQDGRPGDFSPVYRIRTDEAQKDKRRPKPLTNYARCARYQEKIRAIILAKRIAKRGATPNPFGQLAGFFVRPATVRDAVRGDVIALYEQGLGIVEIAEKIACSRSTVTKILELAGLRQIKRRIRREDVRGQIYAMLDAGHRCVDIARAIGSSEAFVYRVKAERRTIERDDRQAA